MIIKHLNLLNFKNLTQADLRFSDGVNCVVGMNGSGKTNLIDAIYYLSFCKSFLSSIDTQNINFESDFFLIQGEYDFKVRIDEVSCSLKRGQKKVFKRNRKDYEKLSDHIGLFPLVVISPADEELINGSSEERRKYIDSVISQFDKPYLQSIIRYTRLILQRNALIKGYPQNFNPAILDVYDSQILDLSESIFQKRDLFINNLLPIFQKYYAFISSDREEVSINYKSQFDVPDFANELKLCRDRDLRVGYSTKGVHRDELEFTLSNIPIRKYGSQGQKKSYLIALKLAHFEYLTNKMGVVPILLLDDIFDKLDQERGSQLINLVTHTTFGQIFITDTQKERLVKIVEATGKPFKVFDVENGDIRSN